MNKIIISLACLSALFVVSCNSAPEADGDQKQDSVKTETPVTEDVTGTQRYGVESGKVVYETFEMMGAKVDQTLYFDDYGNTEVREIISTIEMAGIKVKTHSFDIVKDGFAYHYELENTVNGKNEAKKECTKMDMKAYLAGVNDFSALTEELKKQMDYKEEGTEVVAGVTGTRFSIKFGNEGTRITGVMYKNINLKSDMSGFKVVAKSFEENISIPEDKLAIPADYKIIELSGPMGKGGE
jgi:hypothetical protein